MLTLITPTGTRPEAFANCEAMMRAQTYGQPVRWIIVDDGPVSTDLGELREGWERIVIRPLPHWQPGQNTQGRNLLAGIAAAREVADAAFEDLRLTIIEDDDAYLPGWLERLDHEMDRAELVGEGDAIYYNVGFRRWKSLGNRRHASLRCTGLRGAAIDTLERILQQPHKYYDLRLWRAHQDTHVFFSRLTVGIKAMPGRPGIADGHDGLRGYPDPSGKKLRELLGSFAELFLPYQKELPMTQERFVVLKPFKYPRPNGPSYEPGDEIKFPDRKARRDAEILITAKKIQRQLVVVDAPGAVAPTEPATPEPSAEPVEIGAEVHAETSEAPEIAPATEAQAPVLPLSRRAAKRAARAAQADSND